jgi:hypothetical protein
MGLKILRPLFGKCFASVTGFVVSMGTPWCSSGPRANARSATGYAGIRTKIRVDCQKGVGNFLEIGCSYTFLKMGARTLFGIWVLVHFLQEGRPYTF